MKKLDSIREEDRFALSITLGVHVVLVLFFLIYTLRMEHEMRPSFIEVEFGEFQSGTPTEYAEQQEEQVATQPDPPETEPEEPEPEPTNEEPQEETTEEDAKPVDAPEQEEVIDEEELETPETDEVDPEAQPEQEQEEESVPPQTQEDEVEQEGAESSGDEEGTEGEMDTDQGTGNEPEKSAPYELDWEGDIERSPTTQPLPENTTNQEATITIRFEVNPDGSIGRIVPLRKMNPELEREVMRTLRSWRFSRLPSGVPQQSQTGTITFRFVMD
jgi:TonB family protein